MGGARRARRRAIHAVRWGLLGALPLGCSLLAPPDSEYLSGGSSGGIMEGGQAGAATGGSSNGGASPLGGSGASSAHGGAGNAGVGGSFPGAAGTPEAGAGMDPGAAAGAAGAASEPTGPLCSDHPIPPKSQWTATASEYFKGNIDEVAALAIDGTASRWATGKSQAGDEWLQIDFGVSVVTSQVTLVPGADIDFPVHYQLRASETSENFEGPVLVDGFGTAGAETVIVFPRPTQGRYLLITQIGKSANWWTVAEAYVTCKD